MYTEISNPMNYQTALYARLSKEDGGEFESQSIANQRTMLLDYAKKQNLNVFDVYIDDGFSGTSFDRPAFNRMICDIEAKKVNMVITKDMSRLGRDYIQTGYYLERYFPENLVRYIALLDGIDTGVDSSMNDITPFKAIMNDMYAKDISKKIKSVKHDKQRKGLFIGGKAPYGYVLSSTEKNVLLIDEEAATIVRRIFEMAVEGISCREIAVTLNNEGVPTPGTYANLPHIRTGTYAGLWSSERITYTLKSEMYIGNMVQGKMKKISYKTKKCHKIPPESWIIVKDTHPAIVDKAVFDKVQLLIKSRSQTRSRTHDYLLKGLIFCKECGYPLGVINRPLSGGVHALYTVCRTYQRFTNLHRCTCHCIRIETITNAVMQRVKMVCKQYASYANLEGIADKALLERKAYKAYEDEAVKLNSAISRMTAELDKLYADRLSGLLEDEDFKRFYSRLREERAKLQEKLRIIEEHMAIPDDVRSLELGELVKQFLETAIENKELLVSLVERVEMNEEKELFIYFRFCELEGMELSSENTTQYA